MTEDLERLERGERDVTFNDATVTGYHFDTKADLCELTTGGTLAPNGLQTTIRIQKTFDEQGKRLSYHHVAPLSEGATSIVHPIDDFYNDRGEAVAVSEIDFRDIMQMHPLFGLCSNGGQSGYISFNDLTDSPYHETHASQQAGAISGERDYILRESLSKGYATRLNILFVQSSQSDQAQA